MNLNVTTSQHKANENSFFSIEDSIVVIGDNKQKVNLKLITNVRLIKNRNLSFNFILFILSILCYSVSILFFDKYSLLQLPFLVITIAFIITAVFIRRFSYKLLINKGVYGFNEFLVSKNNLPFAESFIYILKNKRFYREDFSSLINHCA